LGWKLKFSFQQNAILNTETYLTIFLVQEYFPSPVASSLFLYSSIRWVLILLSGTFSAFHSMQFMNKHNDNNNNKSLNTVGGDRKTYFEINNHET